MTSGLQCQHPRRRAYASDAGYSILEWLVVVVVVAILGAMPVLSGHILRERLCDATALIDVVRVGKAIEKLAPETPPFAQTVHGPAAVPHVPGVYLSRETTLFVQYRSVDGGGPDYLIRGSHPSGHSAFVYAGGHLYETAAPPSPGATWIHWIRDLMVLADSHK